jgi:DNA-binding transcriptional ArsR family regulator
VGTYGVDALGALADPSRRSIFEALRRGEASVGELAAGLPISRPAVSQHLKVLKDCGLVADHAVGTRRMYRLRPEGIAGLRAYLDEMWTEALGAFAAAAEQSGERACVPGVRGERSRVVAGRVSDIRARR